MGDKQAQQLPAGGLPEGMGGMGGNQEKAEQQKKQREEQLQSFLMMVLHPEAQDRLARIKLVNEEQWQRTVMELYSRFERGQLGGQKITEAVLIQFLKLTGGGDKKDKIVDRRKHRADDSEEEEEEEEEDRYTKGKGKAKADDGNMSDDSFFD